MKRSNIIMAVVFAAAGTLGATAWADARPDTRNQDAICTVMGHRVVAVTPRVHEESNGKQTRRLEGADVRIVAEPGMTAEYLSVEVQRHVAAMSGAYPMPDCPFGVAGATFQVRPAGDGFVFQITSSDPDQAKEILRRARLMS